MRKRTAHKIIDFLAAPIVVFYALAWLMVLVIVGTIAQRYIGLYQSQMRYFSSFIFWFGPLPLPGGYPTLTVVFVGLTAKLGFKSKWRRENAGTIVTHIGALALLFGGFLTAAFSHEGGMVLPEGETADFISDYNDVELAIIDHSPADHDHVVAFQKGWLSATNRLHSPELPFELEIVDFCKNCQINRRAPTEMVASSEPRRGFAANFTLTPAPLEAENDRNQAGVVFRVNGAGPASDGIYAIFDNMPIEQTLEAKGVKYSLVLRHKQTPLPFKIQLLKFTRTNHPGTEMASAYKSDVVLIDGDFKQRVTIQMNEPLRYKGYTLYQASFVEGNGTQTSVLAVVHNLGQAFPYVSSLIMCVGLLLHLMLQIPKLIARGDRRANAAN